MKLCPRFWSLNTATKMLAIGFLTTIISTLGVYFRVSKVVKNRPVSSPDAHSGGSTVVNRRLISTLGAEDRGSTVVKKQPHFLFILADDLGWSDISWHNNHIKTPHMEKLASEGIKLNRNYVTDKCTPTRAALLTGRYPHRYGRQHLAIRNREPTGLDLRETLLPEELKKLGYSTYIVGKWNLGYCKWAYTPTKRGFDRFYGFYASQEDYCTHKTGYGGGEDLYLDFWHNTEPILNQSGYYSTNLYADYAVNLLRSRNSSEPMFLYLPFQSVHAPIQGPNDCKNKVSHYVGTRKIYLGFGDFWTPHQCSTLHDDGFLLPWIMLR